MMPLYDQNSFIFVFLENSQKLLGGFECAARRCMSDNLILGFFVTNRLAARGTPPSDTNIEKMLFLYFSRSRNHRA